jgi:hypothetical protein
LFYIITVIIDQDIHSLFIYLLSFHILYINTKYPRRKVNILGGHTIGHSKQNMYMYMCPIPNGFRDRAISLCIFLNSGLWGYWHCGHSWPIVPASGDSEGNCGEADGM